MFVCKRWHTLAFSKNKKECVLFHDDKNDRSFPGIYCDNPYISPVLLLICKRFDICYICLFFYYYIEYLVINEDRGEKQMKVVNTILR